MESCAQLKQMEGAPAPLCFDLMGSDVCVCVHCCKRRLPKYCILCSRVVLVKNIAKVDTAGRSYFGSLSGQM